MRLPQPPILVITDRRQARAPLEETADAIFAGGCRWLSLREKDLEPAARTALLRRLVERGRHYGATVMVHEDIGAMLVAGAAGVHLPAGLSPARARQRLGPDALIGLSAHRVAELEAAAAGADYATLSPIFPSESKPGYGPALGLDGLAAALASARLPVIALGGIEISNAESCVRTGAAGVAVMGTVMAAASPGAVMAELIKALAPALAARRSGGS